MSDTSTQSEFAGYASVAPPVAARQRDHVEAGLSAEQRQFWDDNGYLVLKNVLSDEQVAEVLALIDNEWSDREGNRHHVDILSGPDDSKTFEMKDTAPEHRNEVYKLNNLFIHRALIRATAFSPRIKAALQEILDGDPMICNSLNFERGSQQPFHLDTWYMPPPVDNMMVAANIALDPMNADNGPFVYYPASHKIPPYRFSHGRLNIVDSEAADCSAYLQSEVERRGLKPQAFSCEPGDVFLWHAQLLHGGMPIKDISLTRNSLVVHYWRSGDMAAGSFLQDEAGSYIRRTLRGEISV